MRLAKFLQAICGAAILGALLLSFARPAIADTKPKFVYVTNSGDSTPGDQLVTFQLSGTATCANYPCASAISISGSITLDLGLGQVQSSALYLTDSSDLASSPLAVISAFPPAAFNAVTTSPLYFNTQGFYGGQSTLTNLTLYFPFASFPAGYSGGLLCTSIVRLDALAFPASRSKQRT